MLVVDADDFGCNQIITDQCQSHDCRDVLLRLKEVNPLFKITLFAVPGEMTLELGGWCMENKDWVELAYHGGFHSSNYECEKMTYDEFDRLMKIMYERYWGAFYVKGFKAPGWQISDDIYKWLDNHGWWVADQDSNVSRHPSSLKSYLHDCEAEKQGEQKFYVVNGDKRVYYSASHHHTWDVGWNGVYEQFNVIVDRIKDETEFKFVSEVINENYNY